jgi:hypothetical protein
VAVLVFEVGLDGLVFVGEGRHEVLYDAYGARTGWREKREEEKAECGGGSRCRCVLRGGGGWAETCECVLVADVHSAADACGAGRKVSSWRIAITISASLPQERERGKNGL